VREPKRLVMLSAATAAVVVTNPIWSRFAADKDDICSMAPCLVVRPLRLCRAARPPVRRRHLGERSGSSRSSASGHDSAACSRWDDDRRGGGPDASGGRHQPRILAAAIRRCGGCPRPFCEPQRVPFTIVGVTPPDFFGTEVGDRFGRRDPAWRRAAAARQGECARPAVVLVAGRDDAAQAGSEHHGRRGRAARRAAADPRGHHSPTDWRPETLASYLKETFTLQPAANGPVVPAARLHAPLYTLLVIRGTRPARGLREHREPAARPRDGAAVRDERTARTRGLARVASPGSSSSKACCSRAAARSPACWSPAGAASSCSGSSRPRRTRSSSISLSTGGCSPSRRPRPS